jgi:hypothetical protein
VGVKQDAETFARARDVQFDRVKEEADKAFRAEFDPQLLLQYLSILFAKVGSKIIKENMKAARAIGAKHGERFKQNTFG